MVTLVCVLSNGTNMVYLVMSDFICILNVCMNTYISYKINNERINEKCIIV